MGPSGSGKSTLLTIAGTLEEPTSGDVVVGGRDLAECRATIGHACVAARSAMCSRTSTCSPGLTAAENVAMPLELDGMRAKVARAAGLEGLDQLGVADQADRFPDDLSGGERQRVAIARAVVGDRNLLLADEPTGALDSVNGEAVMRLVRAACHRGVAGVVVTHDAQLASWADRVVFLRDGRVVDQTVRRPGPSRCSPRPTSMTGRSHVRCNEGVPARELSSAGVAVFRRDWRQQLLILSLLTVAVAAAVCSITVAHNTSPADDAEFGSASGLLDARRLR